MAIGNPITLTSNVASKNISVTATEDQTLFTVTGGYRINQLAVFRNGVRLVDGSDFTARDGSTVTLVAAANLNDTIEFQIFDDFRVADAINSSGDQSLSGSLSATGGFNVGIQSGGTDIATGVITAINFIGAGNTAVYDASSKTVDISIAGNAGAAGTWANYDTNTGVSTTKKVKIENNLEVTGVTTTATLAVSGVATAASSVVAGIVTTNVSGIDVGAGIITATSFVGTLTGSATTIAGAPDVTLGNVNAGVITATTFVGVPAGFTELDAALFN